jgi:hypothetical protein
MIGELLVVGRLLVGWGLVVELLNIDVVCRELKLC